MLQLAEQYAELKGTKVIASRVDGDKIIFVLESGPKLTMTQAELEEAITSMEPKASALSAAGTPPPATPQAPKTKKGKGK